LKFDANLPPSSLSQVTAASQAAEQLGFDALWSSETQHDPFLPLALVSQDTQSIQFGTSVAIAFARSPGTLAYTAWDLAEASQGRMILGLGTQVRAHIERRFGMPWPESPVGKLRETVGGIRALWNAWQSGEKLKYRGDYLRLGLMTPFFNPGPIDHPDIPIYLAGVNTGMCRLAGEVADGFHAHPLNSAEYLSQVIRPAINQGADRAGRDPDQIALSVSAFVVSQPGEEDFMRSQIAFYASTPSYRPVFELHGWGEVAEKLSGLARRNEWGEMLELIDDTILDTFCVRASEDDLVAALLARYRGVVDRLSLYLPFQAGERVDFWTKVIEGFKAAR
jgi:probable F420-dependent oxidoreductase